MCLDFGFWGGVFLACFGDFGFRVSCWYFGVFSGFAGFSVTVLRFLGYVGGVLGMWVIWVCGDWVLGETSGCFGFQFGLGVWMLGALC